MERMHSVHDNFIYAFVVDCEGHRLVLHTVYRDREPHEFTDVVFRDVVAHVCENVLSGNILFDVEETDVASLVEANSTLFADSWRWGWPPVDYQGDLHALATALQSRQVRAFTVNSSYGLSGWVLAASCELISREEPARLSDTL